MIKKLQRRFILLTMSALFAVLVIIMCCINMVYYHKIVKEADQILTILAENEGTFPELKKEKPEERDTTLNLPEKDFREGPPPDKKPLGLHGSISRETPYESRFFSVTLEKETGTFLDAEIGSIVSVDEKQAASYAASIFAKQKKNGFIDYFRYICQEEGDNVRVIFLDCARSLDSVWNFVLISTGISCLGFAIVTLIILFFSNRIIRPISESYEKQKRFITDASHEIKTPLTIINADADILEMEEEGNEWVADIKKQTKRLTELTNNLVLLTRMEESIQSIPKIDFPISDVVKEAALSFQALAQTQNKSLDLNIQTMLSINGDSKGIHQLVTLLMDNAIKYSPENSTIAVTLEQNPKNKSILLIITNETLSPLTKEQLHSLFERFYRVDTSRNSSTGGYGIGLSVAKAIVDSHNGKIKASLEHCYFLKIQVQLPY